MKATVVAILLAIGLVTDAAAQLRLERINKNADGKEHHTVLWAKKCDGRIEDVGRKESEMYMIVRDCGKTVVAVAPADKVALKMPVMESTPAQDIPTGAAFMQGSPTIAIEKVLEEPGGTILGRATVHYRFKSVWTSDPAVTRESIVLKVDEEFWVDPELNAPALDDMLGKAPAGRQNARVRQAYAAMKGMPLRTRRVVAAERNGRPEKPTEFSSEVVKISLEPFADDVLEWPKDYQYMDMSSGQPQ